MLTYSYGIISIVYLVNLARFMMNFEKPNIFHNAFISIPKLESLLNYSSHDAPIFITLLIMNESHYHE